LISTLQASYSTRLSPNWLSVSIILTLLAASCGEARRDYQLDFYALGTEVTVSLFGVSDAQATRATDTLQSMFADVGHNWYPWRPGELQAMNESLAEMRLPIDVSPRLATVIRRAAEIEILSVGRFNAGLGNLTELWGLHDVTNPPAALPDPSEIEARIKGGVGAELLDWDGDRIVSGRTFLMIDLGGIAKGAILEDSVQILRELGVNHAIVNIGGDLTVLGNVNGRPASIGIRSPIAEKPLASLDVAGGETVVTSGNYERYIEIDGQRYNHILNPQSGYPVEHTASVTVVHDDAMLADAAATALMVGGAEEFDALTEAMNIDFALLIDASGDLRLTRSMDERLHWLRD
jgi:thiamine biosynthesis lipoprotein